MNYRGRIVAEGYSISIRDIKKIEPDTIKMNYIREGFISVFFKGNLESVLFLFSMYLTLSQTEENYKKEGKVVYQIHYDYKSIYN